MTDPSDADTDGDGLDDIFLGGAAGQTASMMLQNTNGQFREAPGSALGRHSEQEDVSAAFFDMDGDGDQDFYLCRPAGDSGEVSLAQSPGVFSSKSKLPFDEHADSEDLASLFFDADGDGKVAKDEAPPRMAEHFEESDADGDGYVTQDEATAMRAKFGNARSQLESTTRGNLGRDLRSGNLSFGLNVDFEVESYLHYQGERFSSNFDANSYLLMTKALDYFDPSVDFGNDLSKAFENSDCRFFLVSFSTDWRFPPERSRELVETLLKAGREVSYLEVEADQGHDAFLMPIPRYINALRGFLDSAHAEITRHAS